MLSNPARLGSGKVPPVAARARFVAARIGARAAMGFVGAMTDRNDRRAGGLLLLAAMLPASHAAAQAAPAPQDTPRTIPGLPIGTPSAAPTPVPVPTEPVRGLSLPTPAATRAVEEPRATAKPVRPAPAGAVPRTPTPVSTPTPMPTPISSPSPDARPIPAPSSAPPAATTTPMPDAAALPPPPATTTAPTASGPWGWIAGALALALAGWLLFRRRRSTVTPVAAAAPQPSGTPSPLPDAVPPPPPAAAPIGPRAAIAVALQPGRAGLNMLSAIVEATVIVRNRGDAPATDIRLHATLLSAHTGQDAELAAAFAAPAGRPANPPFALAPGEERRIRVVAALPRDGMRTMEAAGRPMFVPLLAVDVRYAADAVGTPARTGQAYIVGIERVDSAKLAPFWLDGPLKMHDQIAARPQGPALTG